MEFIANYFSVKKQVILRVRGLERGKGFPLKKSGNFKKMTVASQASFPIF